MRAPRPPIRHPPRLPAPPRLSRLQRRRPPQRLPQPAPARSSRRWAAWWTSIDVTLGSVIAVGDKVATIEAMKMKNDVRSHVAGKVTNIAVIVNQGVETGQVLMTVA